MKKPKKALLILMAALAASMTVAGCGKVKVGYVDSQRIISEAPQIKVLADEGNAKLDEEKKAFEQKMQENPNMSQEDAQKAQMEAQQKIQGLGQSYQLQMKQKVDVALQQIQKEKKLDVIIDSEKEQPTALMGCTDVTDEVIQKLQ